MDSTTLDRRIDIGLFAVLASLSCERSIYHGSTPSLLENVPVTSVFFPVRVASSTIRVAPTSVVTPYAVSLKGEKD